MHISVIIKAFVFLYEFITENEVDYEWNTNCGYHHENVALIIHNVHPNLCIVSLHFVIFERFLSICSFNKFKNLLFI